MYSAETVGGFCEVWRLGMERKLDVLLFCTKNGLLRKVRDVWDEI